MGRPQKTASTAHQRQALAKAVELAHAIVAMHSAIADARDAMRETVTLRQLDAWRQDGIVDDAAYELLALAMGHSEQAVRGWLGAEQLPQAIHERRRRKGALPTLTGHPLDEE